MRVGHKIEFTYHGRRRFGRIHKIKTSNEGHVIVTCWLPSEQCYKSFRKSEIHNLKRVKGFIESLLTF